jgi:CBS domain-containing protein
VCKPDTSVPELLYLLSRSDWNPPMLSVIGEGGELLGVVTEWDILNNLANGLLDSTPGKRGEQH